MSSSDALILYFTLSLKVVQEFELIMNHRNGPVLLLLIAYFTYIVIGIPGGIINIAWTYMQPTFNVTSGSLGILLGVTTAGYLISSVTSGRIIERIGIGNGLVLGSLF